MSGTIIDPSGLVLVPDPNPAYRSTGTFANLDPATLTQALANAQAGLLNLLTTGQPTTVTYGSGDGQKSVTYSRTSEGALRSLIRELKSALGIGPSRRAIGVSF